jgi:ferric-dicitrate binding protein FerR (iron transport regulator)
MDETAVKFGLLMESAQAQQRLAEHSLETLRSHTQHLDALVRAELRRTFVEELTGLDSAIKRAIHALDDLRRAANLRLLFVGAGIILTCATASGGLVWWALPTPGELAALRTQRAALAQNIARLEQSGGRIDLRRCADSQRLCVRVERGSAYGANSDYFVLKGY